MTAEHRKNVHNEFLEAVFPAELEEISRRRKHVGLGAGNLDGEPSADQGLVGLSLSGGGIRSATFSLGVIQSLARHGLMRHVDYLSTVSGGGYIGSCVSSLCNQPGNRTDADHFPLRYTEGSGEPPALSHLRNFSNYLSPGGLLTRLRLPNMMLRGILLNLFIFLPFIMAAVFLTEFSYEKGPHWEQLPVLIPPLLVIFLVLAFAFPILLRVLKNTFTWRRRNAFELWLTLPLLLALLIMFAIPFLNITQVAVEHSTGQFLAWFGNLQTGDVWRVTLTVVAIIALLLLVGKASQNLNRISGKLLLFAVGLLGPMTLFAIYLGLCLWQIDSPFIPADSARALNLAAACEGPCLSSANAANPDKENTRDSESSLLDTILRGESGPQTIQELANALAGRTLHFSANAVVRCRSGNCGVSPKSKNWHEDSRVWVINNAPQRIAQCPPYSEWEAWTLSQPTGDCTYITRGSPHSLRIEGPQLHLFDGTEDYLFLALFVALLLINRMLLDVNITSMHGFYRDRLSRAYIFKLDDNEVVQPNDSLALSELNAKDSSAPYHLINVTMNLQGSSAPDLRGRNSDFFIFSKRHCGSERTGYVKTQEMERHDQSLTLASAMAISGAAAAPNMGSTTNRSLTFIMTLLNIRLGYWLPNPAAIKRKLWFKRIRLGSARPGLIWREALGRLDARGLRVNVSDGGHLENLGIYPLLRRGCKYIIAVDGEADPDMRFNGLVTLMRYARIDLGIEISIDLEGLRKDAEGYSKDHWALGEIRYGDGEKGQLLYVKLSLTGDEPEYLRSYRGHHPEYPHESTADQFFSEDQFEAYRALGEHACEGMLTDVGDLGGFAPMDRALSRDKLP